MENNLNDVKNIIDKFYTQTGDMLQERSDKDATKEAEKRFNKGLAELRMLRLSKENRRGMNMIRMAFQHSIASMQSFQRGDDEEAIRFMRKATKVVNNYVNFALVNRGGRNGR